MENLLATLNIVQCLLIFGLLTILVLNVRSMKRMRDVINSTRQKFIVRVTYFNSDGVPIHSEMLAYDAEQTGTMTVTHLLPQAQTVNVHIIKVPGL